MMVDQMSSLLTVKEEIAFAVPANHLAKNAGDVVRVILMQHTKQIGPEGRNTICNFCGLEGHFERCFNTNKRIMNNNDKFRHFGKKNQSGRRV